MNEDDVAKLEMMAEAASGESENSEGSDDDEPEVDATDSRFGNLFEDNQFSIDRTSSKYKKTPQMEKLANKIAEERRKARQAKDERNAKRSLEESKDEETNDLISKLKKAKKK